MRPEQVQQVQEAPGVAQASRCRCAAHRRQGAVGRVRRRRVRRRSAGQRECRPTVSRADCPSRTRTAWPPSMPTSSTRASTSATRHRRQPSVDGRRLRARLRLPVAADGVDHGRHLAGHARRGAAGVHRRRRRRQCGRRRDRIGGQRRCVQREVGDLTVLTAEQTGLAIPGVEQQKSTLNSIIYTTLAVAALVVALFFALVVLEKRELFAALKALGSPTRQLGRGVVLQAVDRVRARRRDRGAGLARLFGLVIPAEVPTLFRTETLVTIAVFTARRRRRRGRCSPCAASPASTLQPPSEAHYERRPVTPPPGRPHGRCDGPGGCRQRAHADAAAARGGRAARCTGRRHRGARGDRRHDGRRPGRVRGAARARRAPARRP